LDVIATSDRVFVCSAQPATYAEAGTATYGLAVFTVTAGTATFTKANGDSSGRKVTTAQQTAGTVSISGTATHIALGLSTGSVLHYVTTCTSQALTAGNTVTVPAWDIELADAT
jgi:hypothetical protein